MLCYILKERKTRFREPAVSLLYNFLFCFFVFFYKQKMFIQHTEAFHSNIISSVRIQPSILTYPSVGSMGCWSLSQHLGSQTGKPWADGQAQDSHTDTNTVSNSPVLHVFLLGDKWSTWRKPTQEKHTNSTQKDLAQGTFL